MVDTSIDDLYIPFPDAKIAAAAALCIGGHHLLQIKERLWFG